MMAPRGSQLAPSLTPVVYPARRLACWIASAGILIGLISWLPLITVGRAANRGISPVEAFALVLPYWWLWTLLAVPLIPVIRRVEQAARTIPQHVFAHIVIASVVMVIQSALLYASQRILGVTDWMIAVWQAGIAIAYIRLSANVLVYGALVAIVYGVDYGARYRARELDAHRLTAELAQARLDTLRQRLDPHFLFNALNTVTMLVRDGSRSDAVRMLARLSDLLRQLLDDSQVDLIPLRDELAFVQRYMELEQLRVGDRLRVIVDVTPEALEARVPFLVLQPLAENAIRHGIVPNASAGIVTIDARRDGDWLILRVTDDGAGPPIEPPGATREGVGLGTTRRRLDELFGDGYDLRLDRHSPNGGACATLRLPYFVHALVAVG
jgi:two-component sensor histidine kinase